MTSLLWPSFLRWVTGSSAMTHQSTSSAKVVLTGHRARADCCNMYEMLWRALCNHKTTHRALKRGVLREGAGGVATEECAGIPPIRLGQRCRGTFVAKSSHANGPKSVELIGALCTSMDNRPKCSCNWPLSPGRDYEGILASPGVENCFQAPRQCA